MKVERIERAYRQIPYVSLFVDEARRKEGRAGDPELTYGTTTPRLALRLLRLAGAGADDVFYDLGCGLGVPTMVAASICARATGIDLLPQVIAKARRVAASLKLRNAAFIAGDLRKAELGEGTLFYSYSTCFSARTRAAMARRIARARPGARILTVTHALVHPRIRLVKKLSIRYGVMPHAVFLQELLKSPAPASR